MSDPSSEEPKIIVDSDWKEQAQKEKEELERKRAEAQASEAKASEAESTKGDASSEANETSASAAPADGPAPEPSGEPALPEASFSLLISSLVTQAAVSLGQMPDPVSGTTSVNKPMAKHVIDTLTVLDQKTKGNLTDEEAQLLEMMMHQLRVAFVSVN